MKFLITSTIILYSVFAYSQLIDTADLPGDDFRLIPRNAELSYDQTNEYVLISYLNWDSIYRKIDLLSCEDSSWISNSQNVPVECEYWIVHDSIKHYKENALENGFREEDSYYTYGDSTKFTDQACIEKFYIEQKDSIISKSIYVLNDVFLWEQDGRIWQCEFDLIDGKYVKNGMETLYYSLFEISDKGCLYLNSLVKHEGYWNKNKKVGDWNYYSNEGFITKIEIYRKGELISVENLEN